MTRWEGMEEAVAIADAGTFVGAAQLLNVSTSHVSRVIARLEDHLGTQLFHRTTRKVSVTDTGRTFVEQCRRIILERDELLELVHGAGEPQGELRITCSTALGERFVAPMVRKYAMEHSRISLSLNLSNRVVDIIGEGYDLGIRTGHISDARLVGRQIAVRPLETCASPAYLAAYGIPQSIADLSKHQCLVGSSATWHFLENGMPRIFSPHGRLRCNSGNMIADAALAGMGICQLPLFYVRKYLVSGILQPVMQDFRSANEVIWAVYSKRRHLLPKIYNLVSALEEFLQHEIDVA